MFIPFRAKSSEKTASRLWCNTGRSSYGLWRLWSSLQFSCWGRLQWDPFIRTALLKLSAYQDLLHGTTANTRGVFQRLYGRSSRQENKSWTTWFHNCQTLTTWFHNCQHLTTCDNCQTLTTWFNISPGPAVSMDFQIKSRHIEVYGISYKIHANFYGTHKTVRMNRNIKEKSRHRTKVWWNITRKVQELSIK